VVDPLGGFAVCGPQIRAAESGDSSIHKVPGQKDKGTGHPAGPFQRFASAT